MRIITLLIIFCLVAAYIANPVGDPDLWWHITVGRWIVANQQVPHQDYWNTFGAGHFWRAYSWSNEIVLALVDRHFGGPGLLISLLILGAALVGSLMLFFSSIARDFVFGTWLAVYSVLGFYNHFTLRPQVLVWIFFAGVLASCEKLLKGRKKVHYFCLALLGCFWANTHLSAFLGLFAVIGWLAFRAPHSVTVLATLSFLLGTLLTPYLGGEWITFFSKTDHPFAFKEISEFQSATIMQFPTIFILLLIVLLITLAFTTRIRFSFGPLFVTGALSVLGLAVVKFIPFSIIALAAWVASVWSELRTQKPDRPGLFEALMKAREWCATLSPQLLSGIAFLCLSITIVEVNKVLKTPLEPAMVPKDAVDYMIAKNLPHPWLNEFGMGGYMMYRLSDANGTPHYTVPIDGRTNVNPIEIWNLHSASLKGKENWREYIEKVGAKSILWREGGPFITLLNTSKEWCKVYPERKDDDQTFQVFVKKGELPGCPLG